MSEAAILERPALPCLAHVLTGEAAASALALVAKDLKAGHAIPYLGADILSVDGAGIPLTPLALAAALNAKAPAPGRIRNNVWSVAQYIEQRRHRKTLIALMNDIFKADIAPTRLHLALAALPLPLVVDTWYDGAMRKALKGRTDWIEVQGVTRALETGDVWTRAYGPDGAPAAGGEPHVTLLYKPHGAVTPAGNYLVADSDYVEVLTEIDIQSPIPDLVKTRRSGRRFVFVGCRFDDQMLRIYARQIMKRSGEGHVVLIDPASTPTKNELKFFTEAGIVPISASADDLATLL